jgi:hypothetical protein
LTEKPEEERKAAEANWTCAECGTPKGLVPGLRFFRCEGCGALFKLAWRGDRLDPRGCRNIKADPVDTRLATEVLQDRAVRSILILRELSSRIRNLEMSKGSERLTMLCLFIIVCSALYSGFKLTVINPLSMRISIWWEIIIGFLLLSAVVCLSAQWLHRRRLIMRVNVLHGEKGAAERDLENCEAALALRGVELMVPRVDGPQETEHEDEGEGESIISKYVVRRRIRRKRLNLRKE